MPMDWNEVQMVSVYVMVHAVVSRRDVALANKAK
jgi:hypothetical protein